MDMDKAAEKRDAKIRAAQKRRNDVAVVRLTLLLDVLKDDWRMIEGRLSGQLVYHPGVWLSIELAERLIGMLSSKAQEAV